MRTLAIGDIHGCNIALKKLLDLVKPSIEDQLIFLGDYIDRGPASKQVIETLLSLNKVCSLVFIRGNHEVMILDARESVMNNENWQSHNWQSYGGFEALVSYGANFRDDWVSQIPTAHWNFFEQTKNSFETETTIFVHGCLAPDINVHDQPDWILFWETFDKMEPHQSGKRIICGHTPQHSGKPSDKGFAVCIDTRPASGGWLTCLDVNSGAYWQADEKGNTRAGKL